MDDTFQNKLKEIDALIQGAKGEAAQQALVKLCASPLPLGKEVEVARLARRCHRSDIGIRILHPIVRVRVRVKREATDSDRVEYAACLLRIGASSEARSLLSAVQSPEAIAEAWFFEAGARMQIWDYSAAIPLLRKYLSHSTPNAYQRLVARINLGICLSFEEKNGEARSLLLESIEECMAKKLFLLHGISLRMMGNLEADRQEWEIAKDFFKNSHQILSGSPGTDEYLARKWIGIANLSCDPKNANFLTDLSRLKEEALKIRHWESLRDIEFHMARIQGDKNQLEHLYFGTPYPSLKKKFLNCWRPNRLPLQYDWKFGKIGREKEILDFWEGQETSAGGYLKVGQSLHRLYITLCSDFYRPFPVVELFDKVFAGEFYKPNTSELRIRQAIGRLRQWFKDNSLPLELKEEEGDYSLNATVPCTVRVGSIKSGGEVEPRLLLICEKLGPRFTTLDVSDLFKISRRAATDIIQKGVEAGVLNRLGSGNKMAYEVTNPTQTSEKKAG